MFRGYASWRSLKKSETRFYARKDQVTSLACYARADSDRDSGSSAAPINMVFIMPKEFMAPGDEDHEPELEEAMAQLNLEPLPATFEKPEDDKRQHL